MNRQIVLASRPTGLPKPENFQLVEHPVPRAGEGEVVVRNHYLSLDPYMRMRMNDAKSYAKPVEIGEVMVGGTAGEVIESRHPRWRVGDHVVGAFGWSEYGVSDGKGLARVDPKVAPLSVYLGTLGMPGITAWVGLIDIANPQPGATVVVSAASGAVGSVVGQIAKIRGARAVGIAGGAEKCAYVTSELGFDACVDYKAGRLYEDLKAATPQGIDVYFENVGGEILDVVLARANPFARFAVCGMISMYNAASAADVPPIRNIRSVLTNRIRMQGFIVSDRMELWPLARADLEAWFAAGKLKYRETVLDGLASAPAGLIGLLQGRNFGKQLVRLV